ncbi:hypothetical protein GCM10025857_51950 [Alicyclobacillus contaminans]|nr:hypothetical protein GCM10025857_51950 [Alicyclobacillus contaminans]
MVGYSTQYRSISKKKVDILVLLSHLGINEDRQIAKELPEFDVIIGSHTHHLFPNGEQVGNTLLAAAGRFGEYVGEVTLFWMIIIS